MQVGLETADTMGEALVVVLGHPQFYPRFGFQPSVNYGIESPFPVPEDVFMVKPLTNYQEKYQGKQAKNVVTELTEHCHHEIAKLLRQGCY